MEQYDLYGATVRLYGKSTTQVMPEQVVVLNQQHIPVVHEFPIKSGFPGDAMIGKIGEDCLGVYTADCLPIVLVGAQYFAVLHGSRKTLYQGIIHQTVKKLCRHEEGDIDIKMFIGPSIRKDHFEVGADGTDFGQYIPQSFLYKEKGRVTADLIGWAIAQLQFHGVGSENIVVHPDCTVSNNDRWYSWRKEKTRERNWMVVT